MFTQGAQVGRGPFGGRLPPENAEGIIERFKVLLAMNEQRPQCEIKILLPSDVYVLQRTGDIGHPAGIHIETKRVKERSESKEIVEQVTHVRDCARFRSNGIFPPRIASRSSWFLRR